MGSFRNQPAANRGFWAINGNDVLIHDLSRGKTHEYRFYIPWSDKITLVCDQGFTTKKEAIAFRTETLEAKRIKAIEAAEYDVECEVPQWTKHHRNPHPEAGHTDFPWGSPMTFES